MTLRDDIIFVGFLFQWWYYKVDKTRPNEFGFQFDTKKREIVDENKELLELKHLLEEAKQRVPPEAEATSTLK